MAVSLRIFISYSWIDKPLARRINRRLRQTGVEAFLDESHLEPGMPLPASLKHEISRSSHVFVVWTASAAVSRWVAQEIEYAVTVDTRPTIIPLLFVPPGSNSTIADTIGVDFSEAHRFERAFEQALSAIGIGEGRAIGLEELSADLSVTLQETLSIAKVLVSPIDLAIAPEEMLAVQLREALSPDDPSTVRAREKLLGDADVAFRSWKPEGVAVAGLPTTGDPNFHALDFALWCAAGVVLQKTDALKPRTAPELNTYPGILAKVLGATGAGFEAIVLLLRRFPGLASDALCELIKPEQVRDWSLAQVVELYDLVFHLVAEDSGRDQFMPFTCAARFFSDNRARLTEPQRQTFLRLVDINGNGPYAGGPLDLLAGLYTEAAFSEEVLGRILFWVENGHFDRVDAKRRSDMPYLLYGFISRHIELHAPDRDIKRLLDAASQRIRKLFREAKTQSVLLALQWIAGADRLPASKRFGVERGYQEGVHSSEFEGWEHAKLVAPLARALVQVVMHEDDREFEVKTMIKAELKKAGLPEPLL